MQLFWPGSAQLPRLCPARNGCRYLIATVILTIVGSLGLVRGADAVPASSPDLHTFTNQDGKSIKAVILSVAQDDVNMKRDDGLSFKVPVATLSKADQDFIRKWVIQQAQAHGDDVLTFGETSLKTDAQPLPTTSVAAITLHWTEGYKITVTNQTPVHWTNLHLRYIIFRQAGVPGALLPNNFTPTHTNGTVAIDDLPGEQQATVATDKIDLREVSMAPGYYYANGAPPKVADHMQGVWVRVYDDDDNLLQEWTSTKDITKDNTWDALWPPVARGRRGAVGNRGAPPKQGN